MITTIKLKLYPPNKAKNDLLTFLAKEEKRCVNWWVDKIRLAGNTNLKGLYGDHYKDARREFQLGANNTTQSLMVAIRIARTAKKRRRESPYLKSELVILKYNLLKVDKNNLGIVFGGETHWFPFKAREIPQGAFGGSVVKKINGDWYCSLAVKVGEPKAKAYKRVLGVDLGISKIAAIADGKGKHTKFFRGEALRAKRNHYQELRKTLRPKVKQGNVYKLIKRISKKESNWMKDTNHKISREIVNYAKAHKMSVAFEDLKGIRSRAKTLNKKSRRMLSNWAFRQMVDFINYKARLVGLAMFAVDPRETSRTCPKCKNVSRNNRKSQSRFECNKCEYSSNADRVGAMNIAQRAAGLLVNPLTHGQLATALTSASPTRVAKITRT